MMKILRIASNPLEYLEGIRLRIAKIPRVKIV